MEKKPKHIDIQILTRAIAGEATDKQLEELRAWLQESEANRKEYEALKKSWDTLELVKPGNIIRIDREWEYHQTLLHGRSLDRRSVFRSPFMKIAATLVILVGIAILWFEVFRPQEMQGPGKDQGIKIIHLADGSTVTLNVGSKLDYRAGFEGSSRKVSLQGEAYFEVARDSLHPFIIQMDHAEVVVLGTSFNVRAYEETDKIEVTVTEGKVSFEGKDKIRNTVMLTDGERAEYSRSDGTLTKSRNRDRNYLAWKTGIMIFENDSLPQVVDVISRVYHQDIEISSPVLENCRLSTSFENASLKKVLDVLESTLGISHREEKGILYLSGPGCD
ncbi:MAG: FecR domain-containing protein [Bacteroidales bacterium]|nr:FecR domain-containing protein [Bacteroidales bacterium]